MWRVWAPRLQARSMVRALRIGMNSWGSALLVADGTCAMRKRGVARWR